MSDLWSAVDFSRDGYTRVLDVINRAGYRFGSFSDALSALAPTDSERCCLLRHDVDVSMDFAVDMARMEHSLGVRATYFLMLRSPMYNLMSRHGIESLNAILSLGHEVGLHFDAGAARRPQRSLEEDIRFEIDLLSSLGGKPVTAFSFHQPSDEAIAMRVAISGVVNTYHPEQLVGYRYISDSNRTWRDEDPIQLISRALPGIQLLIHPIWWMCSEPQTVDCWDRAIERNFSSEQAQMLATERAYGPYRHIRVTRNDGP